MQDDKNTKEDNFSATRSRNFNVSKKAILGLLALLIILTGGLVWHINGYDFSDYKYVPLPKPIWDKKIDTSQILKIGIITDTHIHPTRIDKKDKSDNSPRMLKPENKDTFNKFNAQMINLSPEMIVHLGDVIEGTNEEDFVGIMGLDLVEIEMKKSEVPVYWAIGNHDLRSVTKDQFREALEMENLNQVIDSGDYRLIILDTNYTQEATESEPKKYYKGGYLTPDIINWMEDNLKTDKRVFIFMHHAAFEKVIERTDDYPKNSISNALEFRKIIEKYNVEAVFNGHIETRLYEEKNGVEYYSLTGIKKSEKYKESYHELTIDSSNPSVRTFYTEKETGEEKFIDF